MPRNHNVKVFQAGCLFLETGVGKFALVKSIVAAGDEETKRPLAVVPWGLDQKIGVLLWQTYANLLSEKQELSSLHKFPSLQAVEVEPTYKTSSIESRCVRSRGPCIIYKRLYEFTENVVNIQPDIGILS